VTKYLIYFANMISISVTCLSDWRHGTAAINQDVIAASFTLKTPRQTHTLCPQNCRLCH